MSSFTGEQTHSSSIVNVNLRPKLPTGFESSIGKILTNSVNMAKQSVVLGATAAVSVAVVVGLFYVSRRRAKVAAAAVAEAVRLTVEAVNYALCLYKV